jgi:hypothetical protein
VVPHTGSVAAFSKSFLLLWFDKWKTPNVEQQLEGRLDALTLVSEGMTGRSTLRRQCTSTNLLYWPIHKRRFQNHWTLHNSLHADWLSYGMHMNGSHDRQKKRARLRIHRCMSEQAGEYALGIV